MWKNLRFQILSFSKIACPAKIIFQVYNFKFEAFKLMFLVWSRVVVWPHIHPHILKSTYNQFFVYFQNTCWLSNSYLMHYLLMMLSFFLSVFLVMPSPPIWMSGVSVRCVFYCLCSHELHPLQEEHCLCGMTKTEIIFQLTTCHTMWNDFTW